MPKHGSPMIKNAGYLMISKYEGQFYKYVSSLSLKDDNFLLPALSDNDFGCLEKVFLDATGNNTLI